MTERELAKMIGVEIEDDGDFDCQCQLNQRLIDRVVFLKSAYDDAYFVIDDEINNDDEVYYVADDDDSAETILDLDELTKKAISYEPPRKSFVKEWRDETGDTSNVIPIAIIWRKPEWLQKQMLKKKQRRLQRQQAEGA